MGDHLALMVDHLLTENTLDVAIRGGKGVRISTNSASSDEAGKEHTASRNVAKPKSPGKMVECRICQEEDDYSNMEAPCSCCGSLKYAHRKCIQRWCNEKGDTICEICLQQFKPGYTAPPKLFQYESAPMNFRGSWENSSQDVHDGSLFDSDYEYSASNLRTIYCRSVAVVFVILLTLRHALPLMIGETEEYTFSMFSLMVLRTAGILVPVLIIVRALTALHQRRRQQRFRRRSSSFEGERQFISSQPHLTQVQ